MQEATFSQAQIKAYRRADVIFVAADGYTLAPSRIRCYTFAKACQERGLNAEVLSFYDHLGASSQGSAVFRMDEREKLRLIALAADVLLLNPTAILYLQKVAYHSLAVALAAATNKNKVVVDCDDYDFSTELFPRIARYIHGLNPGPATAAMAKAANMCVCSSIPLHGIVQQFNPRTEFIPTGTDLTVFDHSLREKAGRPDGGPVELIWLGDIWGEVIMEDLLLAVDAFCALPPSIRDLARFTIIGFGDYWDSFKQLMADNYPTVGNLVMKERIEPGEAPALLARCDIGCLPLADTIFNHCKSPTKMFEYMAMKVAVLGTPMGEVARIIQDGENGMLAADLPGYMRRMGTLILDADKRHAMTERAYATVCDGYHLGAMGDKLVGLLKRLQAETPVDVSDDTLVETSTDTLVETSTDTSTEA